VNKDGKPALHVAVLAEHADAIPVLVQGGADINRKGPNYGNTALHEAVGTTPVSDDVIEALLGYTYVYLFSCPLHVYQRESHLFRLETVLSV